MWNWVHENWATIVGVASAILNLLGGTGVVKPLVDLRPKPPADAGPDRDRWGV